MNLTAYVSAQRTWSRLTFGDGRRTIGTTKHIEKELAEIRAKPDDLEEWVDIMILAIDGYWRAGGKALDLARRLKEKQEVNFNRQWPPVLPENETTEHLRDSQVKEMCICEHPRTRHP